MKKTLPLVLALLLSSCGTQSPPPPSLPAPLPLPRAVTQPHPASTEGSFWTLLQQQQDALQSDLIELLQKLNDETLNDLLLLLGPAKR